MFYHWKSSNEMWFVLRFDPYGVKSGSADQILHFKKVLIVIVFLIFYVSIQVYLWDKNCFSHVFLNLQLAWSRSRFDPIRPNGEMTHPSRWTLDDITHGRSPPPFCSHSFKREDSAMVAVKVGVEVVVVVRGGGVCQLVGAGVAGRKPNKERGR